MSAGAPARELGRWSAILAAVGALAALASLAAAPSGGAGLAPASPGSAAEALSIGARNAAIALAFLAAAQLRLLCPPARGGEIARLSHAAAAVALATIALANAVAIGAGLGALGPAALPRVAPHAPLELAGFGLAALAFLRARRGAADHRTLAALGASSLAALALGALVESFVSGALA